MQLLSQRDPRWGNKYLGFSNTYIRDYGCTITSIAMILGTTPDVVNDRLKAVSGFAQGNLLIWSKIPEAFPGVSQRRVWSYNNDDVKANVPNVLVEVPPNAIGGVSGKHWVVFIGNQECLDPWQGSKRPTSDFLKYGDPTGYCVIGGKWEQPVSEPMATITQKELDEIIKLRDTRYNFIQSVCSALEVGYKEDLISLVEDFKRKIDELKNKPPQVVEKIVEKIVTKEVPVEVIKEVPVEDSKIASGVKNILYGRGFWWTKINNLKKFLPK